MFGRSASAPATQPQPPAPPAAAQPPAPPAPPAPAAAAEPKFWVMNGTAPQLMPASQARAFPPTTSAMREDQAGGWTTLAALLGAAVLATPARPAAPAQAFNRPTQQGYASGSGASMGLFRGVEAAQVFESSPFLTPGEYVVRVGEVKAHNGRNGNSVIVEVDILESSWDANKPETQEARQKGITCSVHIKKNESFLSNIKEIIIALSGFDANGQPRSVDSTVTETECEALVSAEQPFNGVLAYLESYEKPTRAGGTFTKVKWYACPRLADGSPDLAKISPTR